MIINTKKIFSIKLKALKKALKSNNISLQLDILYTFPNKASDIFIKKKKEVGEKLGVKVNIHKFKNRITEDIIKTTCQNLNLNPNCTGYFFQLPLAKHLSKEKVIEFIDPAKDVDCLTSANLGHIMKGEVKFIKPATVEAIIAIIKSLNLRIKGKYITIINDSNLIGKPLSTILLSRGATVTICNEFTRNLPFFTKKADIIITATGKPHLITEEHISKNSILIDAGFSAINNKTTGDADFDKIFPKVKAISSVPGGVGPLTVICLFENLLKLYDIQKRRQKSYLPFGK